MKNLIKTLFICLMVVATYNDALAQAAQVQIGWTLPVNPPADMQGIKIKHNGTLIQDLPATATGWTGQAEISEGENTFEVITYDAGGNESEPARVIKDVDFAPPPVTDLIVNINQP